MKLEELKTYDELQDYLLERMDFADDKTSKMNPSFTREQVWNWYMDGCIKYKGQNLPIKTISLLIKDVKKDFNQEIS